MADNVIKYVKVVIGRKLREILDDSVQSWDDRYSL